MLVALYVDLRALVLLPVRLPLPLLLSGKREKERGGNRSKGRIVRHHSAATALSLQQPQKIHAGVLGNLPLRLRSMKNVGT